MKAEIESRMTEKERYGEINRKSFERIERERGRVRETRNQRLIASQGTMRTESSFAWEVNGL
jgi:hypothetical protein